MLRPRDFLFKKELESEWFAQAMDKETNMGHQEK